MAPPKITMNVSVETEGSQLFCVLPVLVRFALDGPLLVSVGMFRESSRSQALP